MTFENRIAQIEANRSRPSVDMPEPDPGPRESSLVTLLLWALFLALVWAALAYPLGAALAFFILGPVGAIALVPFFWLRRRNRNTSPERSAILDLLNFFNPLS